MRNLTRSDDEKQGALLAIRKLMAYPEWQVFEKEVLRFRDSISEGMYKTQGESLAKEAGILKGIYLALYIDEHISVNKSHKGQ